MPHLCSAARAFVVVLALASCGSGGAPGASGPPPIDSTPTPTAVDTSTRDPGSSSALPPSTALLPASTTPAVAPSSTAVSATSSPAPAVGDGPFEIVLGRFAGIGQGTRYATAVASRPALAGPAPTPEPTTKVPLCSILAPFSELRQDGSLVVLFEGPDLSGSFITNWYYDGSDAGGLQLVGRGGVEIGSDRATVDAAYPDSGVMEPWSMDFVDVDAFRIGFEDDRVAWFAVIDCGD